MSLTAIQMASKPAWGSAPKVRCRRSERSTWTAAPARPSRYHPDTPVPVRGAGVERVRIDADALVVSTQVVRAAAYRAGESAVVVGPCERQQGRHHSVAAGFGAGRIVEARDAFPPRRGGPQAPFLPVVQRVPVVRSLAGIEHQPSRLPAGDEFHTLLLRLATRAREHRVAVTDLDR